MNPNHPTSQYRIARIKAAIDVQPRITHEIAELVGISERWVKQYIDHLVAQGQARIGKWVPYGAHQYPVAAYCGKPGADARKPKKLTPADRKRRLLKRMKQDDRYELFRKKMNAQRRKIKTDPLVAALFGTTKKEETHESNYS